LLEEPEWARGGVDVGDRADEKHFSESVGDDQAVDAQNRPDGQRYGDDEVVVAVTQREFDDDAGGGRFGGGGDGAEVDRGAAA
jgi:hypothetical protein